MSAALLGIDWLTLAPVLAPALGVLLVLVADAIAPRARGLHLPLGMLAVGAGLGALPFAATGAAPARTLCPQAAASARCFYEVGSWGLILQASALASALLVLLLLGPGTAHVDRAQRGGPAVTVALVLATTTGAVALAAARDLPTWLVAVELATLPAVALVALSRAPGAESGGLSLLMVALTSFGLLTVGVALWVLATGSATFSSTALRAVWGDPAHHRAALLALLLMIAGLGFKLSAVPFHTWTPQAFVSADEAVAAFLATTSKVAALAGLLVLLAPVVELRRSGESGLSSLTLALGALAIASMTLGNLLALRVADPVRLLAWSTVAQGGWLLLALAPLTVAGAGASAGYLVAYVVATLAVFAVVAAVHSGTEGPGERTLTAYAGLARSQPLLAGALGLGLLTLAGLPPGIVGLVAKVVALRPAVEAGQWWLVVAAIVNVVLGIAVYLRWLLVLLRPAADAPARPRTRLDPGLLVALILASALLLILSVVPGLVFGTALR